MALILLLELSWINMTWVSSWFKSTFKTNVWVMSWFDGSAMYAMYPGARHAMYYVTFSAGEGLTRTAVSTSLSFFPELTRLSESCSSVICPSALPADSRAPASWTRSVSSGLSPTCRDHMMLSSVAWSSPVHQWTSQRVTGAVFRYHRGCGVGVGVGRSRQIWPESESGSVKIYRLRLRFACVGSSMVYVFGISLCMRWPLSLSGPSIGLRRSFLGLRRPSPRLSGPSI